MITSDQFKQLPLEEQLAQVADLILYYAEAKTSALEAAGKTRVDSCLEAQKFHNLEKYWENMQTNVRRLGEMETNRIRRGL